MSPYDPSAFPPFAVTVDLVVLTVRRHALCALVVRRGEPPFQGRWALPGGFVRADEDLAPAAARELARRPACWPRIRPHRRRRRRPPRAARHLRRSRPRPADARRQRRAPGARARPARAHARAATPTARAGLPSTTCSGRTAARAEARAGRRRSPSTTRRSWPTAWSGPARRSSTPRSPPPSARRSSPSESCAGCTRRCGEWPSTPQLPPQGHRHARLPGAHRRDDDASGRPPRTAVQGRRGHPAQPADAAARGLTRTRPRRARRARTTATAVHAESRTCRVILLGTLPCRRAVPRLRERSDDPGHRTHQPPRRDRPARRRRPHLRSPPGRVTALLGARGPGKTTALRLMLELEPGRGITLFRGRPLHRIRPSGPRGRRPARRRAGSSGAHRARPPPHALRGRRCAGATGPTTLLDVVGLSGLADQRLGDLSLRHGPPAGLACALLGDPHTLVLDEPARVSRRARRWAARAVAGAMPAAGRDRSGATAGTPRRRPAPPTGWSTIDGRPARRRPGRRPTSPATPPAAAGGGATPPTPPRLAALLDTRRGRPEVGRGRAETAAASPSTAARARPSGRPRSGTASCAPAGRRDRGPRAAGASTSRGRRRRPVARRRQAGGDPHRSLRRPPGRRAGTPPRDGACGRGSPRAGGARCAGPDVRPPTVRDAARRWPARPAVLARCATSCAASPACAPDTIAAGRRCRLLAVAVLAFARPAQPGPICSAGWPAAAAARGDRRGRAGRALVRPGIPLPGARAARGPVPRGPRLLAAKLAVCAGARAAARGWPSLVADAAVLRLAARTGTGVQPVDGARGGRQAGRALTVGCAWAGRARGRRLPYHGARARRGAGGSAAGRTGRAGLAVRAARGREFRDAGQRCLGWSSGRPRRGALADGCAVSAPQIRWSRAGASLSVLSVCLPGHRPCRASALRRSSGPGSRQQPSLRTGSRSGRCIPAIKRQLIR